MKKKTLTKEEIIHLAALSSLKLDEQEIEKIRGQLIETLDYIENLNELDTANTNPADHVVDLKNPGFEDGQSCERTLSKEDALRNTKNKKDNFFTVKRIL